MIKTGGFWADEGAPREYCYRIVPLELANNIREMTVHAFDKVYDVFGRLGYLFRDAGHDAEKVVVSLDRPISLQHLEQLEDTFSIQQDSGVELGFC